MYSFILIIYLLISCLFLEISKCYILIILFFFSLVILQLERRSLISFRELLSLSIEVLSLWRLLYIHRFHVVTAQLPLHIRDQLITMHFSSIVVSGHQVNYLFIYLIIYLIINYIELFI